MPQRMKLKQRMKQRIQMKQAGELENIFFEEVLTLSNVPPKSAPVLILPALFVKEHGGNISSLAMLRSVESGKSYTVNVSVGFWSDESTCFFALGWEAFTVANELVVNDKLRFVLVAPSTFEVSIKRSLGESSTSSVPQDHPVPTVQLPISSQAENFAIGDDVKAAANGRNKSKEPNDVAPAEISQNKSKEPDVAEPEAPQVPFECPNDRFFDQMVQEMQLHQLVHEKKEDCLTCKIDSFRKGKEISQGSEQMSFHPRFRKCGGL